MERFGPAELLVVSVAVLCPCLAIVLRLREIAPGSVRPRCQLLIQGKTAWLGSVLWTCEIGGSLRLRDTARVSGRSGCQKPQCQSER